MKVQDMSEPISSTATLGGKIIADAGAYSIAFATILKILPPLAALISILWIGFQFYHSEPIKEWRKKRKGKDGNL